MCAYDDEVCRPSLGIRRYLFRDALAYVTIDLDCGAACKALCLNFKVEL